VLTKFVEKLTPEEIEAVQDECAEFFAKAQEEADATPGVSLRDCLVAAVVRRVIGSEFARARLIGKFESAAASFHARIASLEARLAETEAKSMHFRGVHQRSADYARRDAVTHKGSLWVATCDTREVPGTGQAWQLAVKSGEVERWS
jgi:hypothetical protein